jgi:DNA-binding beta-propeller fold protein YncE
MNSRALRCVRTLLALVLSGLACAQPSRLTLEAPGQPLTIDQPGLYPETLEYDGRRHQFLVGSFRNGTISTIDAAGHAAPVVEDPRLCSVLGIAVDPERAQVWAVNADLGACLRPSAAGPRQLAAVGVYDLSSGIPALYVDLAPLAPGAHLLNGIALDSAGNAYVTDSFSPVIYRVDRQGTAAVFLRSEQFGGEGVNLNGVVVHPDGYLLVVKKSDGSLYKVPLANPALFSKVAIASRFVGGDGLVLVGKRELVVVANQVPQLASNSASALTSDDGWLSARVRSVEPLGDGYPTTAVLRDGKLYVVQSQLNQLIQAPRDGQEQLRARATIRQIGRVSR